MNHNISHIWFRGTSIYLEPITRPEVKELDDLLLKLRASGFGDRVTVEISKITGLRQIAINLMPKEPTALKLLKEWVAGAGNDPWETGFARDGSQVCFFCQQTIHDKSCIYLRIKELLETASIESQGTPKQSLPPSWKKNFDEHQRHLIQNCCDYANDDPAGMPGHALALIINKLVIMMNQYVESL